MFVTTPQPLSPSHHRIAPTWSWLTCKITSPSFLHHFHFQYIFASCAIPMLKSPTLTLTPTTPSLCDFMVSVP